MEEGEEEPLSTVGLSPLPLSVVGLPLFCSQNLREEVTQLTQSLRRAETETKVLQEALEGQLDPSCQLMATNWIQEKVFLSQEVTELTKVLCK